MFDPQVSGKLQKLFLAAEWYYSITRLFIFLQTMELYHFNTQWTSALFIWYYAVKKNIDWGLDISLQEETLSISRDTSVFWIKIILEYNWKDRNGQHILSSCSVPSTVLE